MRVWDGPCRVRTLPETDPLSSDPLHGWRRLGWLIGLPVLGLLVAGAITVSRPHIAESLTSAANVITRECSSGEGNQELWLRIEASGRDLIALGEAPDDERRMAALARLATLPGLRRLIDRTGRVEEASPFVWTASMTESGRIVLTGSRPTEIGASALAARLASALPSGTQFTDHARAARGAPPGFAEAAAYTVERMQGLKPGAVATLTDTVLSFEGEAASPAAYDAIYGAQTAPPRGFTLGTAEIEPPLVEDFRFVVERRPDGGMNLLGHTVSEEARAAIRSAATSIAAGAPVEDRMQTARGLPSSVDATALGRFGMKLAELVQDGSVRYEGGAFSASGLALDAQALSEVEALLRDERPAGVSAGTVSLTARPVSPYRLRIRREPDAIVLSGHLPDRAAREALLAALRPNFFREAIIDRTRTADGAFPGLVEAVTAGLAPLSTLASGEIAVSDKEVRLSGESLYAESARRLATSLPQAMPRGWSAAVAVEARDAPARHDAQTCARLFQDRIAGRTLRFAAGSSELRPDFYPVLDAVAEIARTCPAQRVEVIGHADPAGSAAPQPKPLPEFAAAKQAEKAAKDKTDKEAKKAPAPKAAPPKDVSRDARAEPPKPEAKPAEPAPEPALDLSQQRALAIVDYLRKAGLAPDRAVTAQAPAPLGDKQGVGLALRS